MLTVDPERGARWTEEVSPAACALQTAPTSLGEDRCAAPMERPTKTNAHCWRRNVKATQTWTCNTREGARVSKYYFDRSVLFYLVLCVIFLITFSSNVFVSTETCRDVLCPGSSTCVVDQTNNAYCVTCNRICPEVTSPEQYLCGNDGIIYASACHLRRATCLLGRSIGVAYEGKCISKSESATHPDTLNTVWVHFLPGQHHNYSPFISANIPPRRGS